LLVILAEDSGIGSQERKLEQLADLIDKLDPQTGKYLIRIVLGRLRLGFSDMTILDALSWMETGGKGQRKELENAYQLFPDIGALAKIVKAKGSENIAEQVTVTLGVPVIPALAQRLKTADEMIEKMGKVAVEPKFDGTRIQIHFRQGKSNKVPETSAESDWTVRTFTRNLDESSAMFPELEKLSQYLDADELILDSEGIGYDSQTGELRPFQETIQRKRKHGVAESAASIPIKFFVFDVLYKDGKSLVKEPYHVRRDILKQAIRLEGAKANVIEIPEAIVTEDPEEIRAFHAAQLGHGFEGALVKKWSGVYEPGRKGWNWVKFKEAETSQAKLSDTIDAMVMGLYVGKGKRTDFGVGAFLVGVRGEGKNGFEEDTFYTISKVGTGLSDDQWKELFERSQKLKVSVQPKEYQVAKSLIPDRWLNPGLVVEIAADEITISPMHTAKLALRFPRLIKFRDDKGANEITTTTELGTIG
jgi:DNA ligase-1